MTLLPSSATAINSIGTSTNTAASSDSPRDVFSKQATASHPSNWAEIIEDKRLHGDVIKHDQTAADLANSAPSSIIKKRSTAVMKPDVGILSKDFLKNKGIEKQPIDKQFAIHRKKQVAVDVDVGILSNRRRQQASRANLHAENRVTGRSLQSVEEFPWMCPNKNGYPGYYYFGNLFNKTDSPYFTEEGYFPKCSCSRVSPTTWGPNLCECLELDADGDILQCMDSFNQLCEGTMDIDGIPGPWSMEECLGIKSYATLYCSYLPCFVDGSSYYECKCNMFDSYCTEYRDAWVCARSKCCQAQTDDEGRGACFKTNLWESYYDEETSFSISMKEMISRFNKCAFYSDDDKSIVECYCESFSYGRCANDGGVNPEICEAMNCCYEQTEDDARLDCFSRFRDRLTGRHFDLQGDEIQESCIASGKSSDQCNCDIHGLSNCVGVGNENFDRYREPRCDLFQCCQSQTDDNDLGRNDCLVQDEAQLSYETCINDGNTTESCYCDKSNALCSSGHSNDRYCELSSCCQEQANDTGRKECIGNFTTSQPSSAPSSSSSESSILPEIEASSPAADNVSTSSASTSCWIDVTSHLVLAAVVGITWLSQ